MSHEDTKTQSILNERLINDVRDRILQKNKIKYRFFLYRILVSFPAVPPPIPRQMAGV
jgi:hypothetical protein